MSARLGFWLTATWLITTATASAQPTALFTRVVDTTDGYVFFNPPAIGLPGTVAFQARVTGGAEGVFRITNGVRTTLAHSATGPLAGMTFGAGDNSGVTVNGSGQVAFTSLQGEGNFNRGRVLLSSGGTPTVIADSGSNPNYTMGPNPGGFTNTPWVNESGTVSFNNEFYSPPGTSNGVYRVVTGNGGPLTVAADNSYTRRTAINASGTVAFERVNGSTGVVQAIIRAQDGNLTTIAAPGGQYSTVGSFNGSTRTAPLIDSDGRVVFYATTPDSYGIFAGSGGSTTPLYTSSSSQAVAIFSINETGGLAVLSNFGSLLSVVDGQAIPIIGVDSQLDGSTVQGILIGQDALNDSGQIAFQAFLADGRQGIYVFTPVPEPSSLLAVVAVSAGGLWLRRRLR